MARVKKVKEVPHGLCPNCGQSKCECRPSEKAMAVVSKGREHMSKMETESLTAQVFTRQKGESESKESPRTTGVVQPEGRTLRLLSWDKGIQAGMLHIQADGKSAVYHVRRIGNVAKSFTFCKVQPTEHGLQISNPYNVNVYREKTGLSGVCHCDGYKHRKQCRHVDAAITMVEEYNV